jgi:hypothetical protein
MMPCRIPPDNILTPKAKHSSTTSKKPNAQSQQQHNTMTLLPRIISTMPRTPPKRNKVNGTNDASTNQKHQKTTINAKGQQASDDTSSKTGAKTINNVNNLEASHDADANSTDNAQPDEQQTNLQSQGTTNSNKSNAVSYSITFYLMHTIAHVILCWSPSLI